jgi:hypothetical protein
MFQEFDALWLVLEAMLCDQSVCPGPVYIVLDGLNECHQPIPTKTISDVEAISESLRCCFTSVRKTRHETSVKIVVTSRKLLAIETAFREVPTIDLGYLSQETSDDLKIFITSQVEKHFLLPGDQWRASLIKQLETRAEGTFLWVGFAMSMLRGKRAIDVQKSLAKLPSTLAGMYARMLSNIEPDHMERAFRILQWVVIAARPLSLAELGAAVSIEDENGLTAVKIVAAKEVFR